MLSVLQEALNKLSCQETELVALKRTAKKLAICEHRFCVRRTPESSRKNVPESLWDQQKGREVGGHRSSVGGTARDLRIKGSLGTKK